jgi:signal peptidase I
MGNILKVLFLIAAVLGIVIGIARLTAIRWWRVPGDDPALEASIAPTLRGGDLVLLWRATPPAFGALVVCPDPEDASRVVIGRIVGEGRDKLTIDGDSLEINDRSVHTETNCSDAMFEISDPFTGSPVEQSCVIEDLGGVGHMRGSIGSAKGAPPPSTREVGQGKVFLVSDNRRFPYDSRSYGSIDASTCKESIFFRLVSKNGFLDVKPRFTYVR